MFGAPCSSDCSMISKSKTRLSAAIATINKMIKYDVQDHLIKCGELITKGWEEVASHHKIKI